MVKSFYFHNFVYVFVIEQNILNKDIVNKIFRDMIIFCRTKVVACIILLGLQLLVLICLFVKDT